MAIDEKLAGYEGALAGEPATHANEAGATQVPAASVPEMKSLLGIAVAAVVIGALYFAQDVLIPITLAVMLSFLLSPLVQGLQRSRVARAPAVIITVLLALGVIGMVGTLIASQAATLSADAPQYAQTIERKLQGIRSVAADRLGTVMRELGSSRPPVAAPRAIPSETGAVGPDRALIAPGSDVAETRPVLVEMAPPETSPFEVARTILAPIIGPLETLIIVLVVAIFVLLQKEDLRDRFIRLFGSGDLHRTTLAMDEAGERLSRYFLAQLAINTAFGIVIGLGLWAIGIPAAGLWGILAGLLRFVPYIGSFLAAVAPIALGAAIDPGWSLAIYAGLLFVVVEPLVGYVVEPLLYGHSTGLSPVSVIIAAVFWTWIWGPIGLIISTPLTLCLVVLGRHVKSLEVFDVLLGDRPALSNVETFYQRLLADNPDEALAQAETVLTDNELVDYYDEIAVPGLRLAVDDVARGTLGPDRCARMLRSMLSVIGDLEDFSKPSAGTQGIADTAALGTVACVAGRGPFDKAAAVMLAQLLDQRGIATRVISHRAASREAAGSLNLSDVAVVAVSSLELSGSPAHLRYLIRRLKARAPEAAIVVGPWPETEPVLTDADLQRTLGASEYAASLGAAVDRSLAHISSVRQGSPEGSPGSAEALG